MIQLEAKHLMYVSSLYGGAVVKEIFVLSLIHMYGRELSSLRVKAVPLMWAPIPLCRSTSTAAYTMEVCMWGYSDL
jgi:hypothetical protein